jgi:hypothetical protein
VGQCRDSRASDGNIGGDLEGEFDRGLIRL